MRSLHPRPTYELMDSNEWLADSASHRQP